MLKFKVKALVSKALVKESKADEIDTFIRSEIEKIVERYKNNYETYMKVWEGKAVSVEYSRNKWEINMAVRIMRKTADEYSWAEMCETTKEKGNTLYPIEYIDKTLKKQVEQIDKAMQEEKKETVKEYTAEEIVVHGVLRKIIDTVIRDKKSLLGIVDGECIIMAAEMELIEFAERIMINQYGSDKNEMGRKIIEEYKKAAISCGR